MMITAPEPGHDVLAQQVRPAATAFQELHGSPTRLQQLPTRLRHLPYHSAHDLDCAAVVMRLSFCPASHQSMSVAVGLHSGIRLIYCMLTHAC